MEQHLFDILADALVAEGKEVSYAAMRESLAARNRGPGQTRGKSVSDRDLQVPYKDWRDRRGYKKHLTVLQLPETMEKLIASFTKEAMELAAAKVLADREIESLRLAREGLDQARREVAERDARLHKLTQENRHLREEAEALRKAEPTAGVRSLGGQKPRGIAKSTAHHFWDRVALRVAVVLRKSGEPMTIDQLVDAIDADTKTLAAAAFKPIDATSLAKRLSDRVRYNRYRLDKDGDFYVLRKRPKGRAPAPRAA